MLEKRVLTGGAAVGTLLGERGVGADAGDPHDGVEAGSPLPTLPNCTASMRIFHASG
jgi:hypothetical protein